MEGAGEIIVFHMERLKGMKNDYELFNSCPHGCWNQEKVPIRIQH